MNTAAPESCADQGELRHLVLVRHGETADNLAGRFLGRGDPPLTLRGAEAARALAPTLHAGGAHPVVTSPARRAVETARALGIREPVVDGAFREVDFGAWEGLTLDEVAQRDPQGARAFARGEIAGFPGGETVAAAQARVVDALRRYPAADLVVVTHATVIRVLVAALIGLPANRYRALLGRPPHLSWTELEAHDGVWRLVVYGAPPPPMGPAPVARVENP